MKLLIKGDSLRLRVTRSELARLLIGERIEDSIDFSSAPDVHLNYALRSAEQSIPISIECVPQADYGAPAAATPARPQPPRSAKLPTPPAAPCMSTF